jgi:hypothetical protein
VTFDPDLTFPPSVWFSVIPQSREETMEHFPLSSISFSSKVPFGLFFNPREFFWMDSHQWKLLVADAQEVSPGITPVLF